MNTDNVTTEDWIVAGSALLLAIALLFFPWFHLSVSVGTFSVSADYSATSTPDGWLGVLALIATVLVLADIAVERLSPDTEIPSVRGSRTETRFILAAVAAGFVALKFLFHIHFSLFGWGFYVTVLVAAALVYFTAQQRGAAPSLASRTSRPGGAAAGAAPTGAERSDEPPSDAPRSGSTGGSETAASETGGSTEPGGSETGGSAEPGRPPATSGATGSGGASESGGSPRPGGSVPPPGS